MSIRLRILIITMFLIIWRWILWIYMAMFRWKYIDPDFTWQLSRTGSDTSRALPARFGQRRRWGIGEVRKTVLITCAHRKISKYLREIYFLLWIEPSFIFPLILSDIYTSRFLLYATLWDKLSPVIFILLLLMYLNKKEANRCIEM